MQRIGNKKLLGFHLKPMETTRFSSETDVDVITNVKRFCVCILPLPLSNYLQVIITATKTKAEAYAYVANANLNCQKMIYATKLYLTEL